MSLSEPRVFFGVHSVAPYSRSTGLPFGIAKVLASSSLAVSGELVKLNGGSNKWPWAIEDGLLTAEISLNFREYPDFAFELFLGKAPTVNAAEASGSATALTNKNGVSTVDATTGIATVGVKAGSEADLKFTSFIVKVVSPTTVDVYATSDLDFARGADKEFENDALKITASPLTIVASTPVEVPGYGVELTGGSGAIAMVADDTAEFSVRPPNTKSTDVVIGATTDFRPEFGMIAMAAQRSDGSMVEFDMYRCKAVGLPIGLNENAFSEAEVTAEAFYDSVKNAVFKMRHVIAS